MKTNRDDDAFEPVLDASTPYVALPAIAHRLAEWSIAETRRLLAADQDLSPRQVEGYMDRLRPVIEQRAIEAVEAGWQRLQLDRHGVQ